MRVNANIAPGTLSGDSMEVMRVSGDDHGVAQCMKCGSAITETQRYFNFHDRCLACMVCGEEMLVTYKDGPADTWCRACAVRADAAAREIESTRVHDALNAATAGLLDGTGTRDEREAWLEIVKDYYMDLGEY